MLEYEVQFISITGKKSSKTFRNTKDVLDYIARYKIDTILENGEDFSESYTMEEFEEKYKV